MRVVRRLRTTPAAVLAVAIVGTMALPLVATADSSGISCPGRVTTTADGWQRIAAPSFGGNEKITAYAVAPKDTALWATNGKTVMRSGDGGCRWTRSYALPASASAEAPFSTASATILDVVAAKERTYLLVRDTVRPYVLVSDENGASWKVASIPAAQESATDGRLDLAADATGSYAYLLVHAAGGIFGVGAGDVIYATDDGGSTWAVRPGAVRTTEPGQIVDIAVDPLSGTDIWAASTWGLHFSIDGGQTWMRETASKADSTSLSSIAVTHRPGGTAQVVAANQSEELVYVRTSDGSWTTINTPGLVSSATGGRTATQAAITTSNGVYELDFDALKWLPVHGRNPLLSRMSTTYTTTPLLYACECGSAESALWTRSPRRGVTREPIDRGPDGPGYPGFYGCAPDSKQQKEPVPPPPSAVETKKEITLEPGRSATVPVTFRVQPRELDLYFLLDSGPRSTYFGCEASQGAAWAADKLASIRNLRVGAGEYRDFPTIDEYNIWANCINQVAQNNFVYRRALRVGPVDKVFRNTLGGVQWGGCNGDFAGLTALYQTATGDGKDVAPAGSSPLDIRPRQDAGFNADAMKVVVHVAGGYFAQPSATYPGASFDEAIAALNAKGIKQIGIHVPYAQKKHHTEAGPVPDETGADDLRRVARETGTLSTKAFGCGAKVQATVAVGAPLVCSYVDGNGDNYTGQPRKAPDQPPMGKQMVDLVTALSDPQPMKVAVLSGDASLKAVKAPARPLDHLLPQTLDYAVTVTCGPKDYGKTKKVELGGRVGADVVAATSTVVHCGAPPVPQLPPPPSAPERRIAPLPETVTHAALPIQAGAVLGNTPPHINPGTQAQAQAQGQAQAQAQGGMAGVAVPQEQEQIRLAYTDAVADDPDTQLAMSGLPPAREEDVPIWAFVTGAALMTAAAGSVAFRRGHAVATATVRRR